MSATIRLLPFAISKFPITARNARIFAIFIFGIFMASIWLLLSRFDMRITEVFIHLKFYEKNLQVFQQYHFMDTSQSQCKLLNDPLAISTLSRMRNKECTLLLEEHLCEIGLAEHWPVNEVNNGCGKYFGKKNCSNKNTFLYLFTSDDSKRNEEFGCFNSKSSNLKEYRINLISNSPENCVQICLRASFSFAGFYIFLFWQFDSLQLSHWGLNAFVGILTKLPVDRLKIQNVINFHVQAMLHNFVEELRLFGFSGQAFKV